MTVHLRNLSKAVFANGWTLHNYRHAGDIGDVFAPGFWNDVTHFRPGDWIAVSAHNGAAQLWVEQIDEAGGVWVVAIGKTPS
jgi:hypothetical protein